MRVSSSTLIVMLFGALVANLSISTALALQVKQPMIEKVSNAVHALEKNFVPQVEHIREEEAALEEEIEHLDEAVHAAVTKEEEDAPEERRSRCDRKQDCIDEGIDSTLGSESRFASIRGPSKRQLLMMGPGGRELLAKIKTKCESALGIATCRCEDEPCKTSGRGTLTGVLQYAERVVRKAAGRGKSGKDKMSRSTQCCNGLSCKGSNGKKVDGNFKRLRLGFFNEEGVCSTDGRESLVENIDNAIGYPTAAAAYFGAVDD
jgi:hypothetical protein